MIFAYWLEDSGISLEYEKCVNPKNDKSIDFYALINRLSYYVELVRVENSDEVTHCIEEQKMSNESSQSLIFRSDHENKYFRTASQLIRLQEKILEKIDKFGEPSEQVISIIVVDCTNINLGMLDHEDIRIVTYGKACKRAFQEYWGEFRLKGLFESSYTARNAESLRKKIAVIIFIPELKIEIEVLKKSYFVVNPAFNVAFELQSLPAFSDMEEVKPKQ